MTRREIATVAGLSAVLAACAAGLQSSPPDASRAPESQPAVTARPLVSTAPTVAATERPTPGPTPVAVELQPAFTVRIAEDGDINRVAVVGKEIWAPTGESIVRVNTKTRKTSTIESPVSAAAADAIGATPDAVWIGDFDHGKIYRLDRTTGAVLSELRVPGPVTFAHAHNVIWIGSGPTKAMYKVDPAGSEATRTDFPHELLAAGSAWGAGFGQVIRIAIDTGEKTTIKIAEPKGPGDCSVRGSTDSIWLHCHGNDTVARLDPETNSVIAIVEVGGPVFGGVLTIEDWAFFIEGLEETGARGGRIVRVDLQTNQIDRIFDLGPRFDPNPAVVVADALWVPIAGAGELWVLPLADLLAE